MQAVIVEDEILSSQHLIRILKRIGNIDVLAQPDSIDDTVEWFLNNEELDLLFLDIHLADGSAFEIFQRIEIKCTIIFTTAYDEYALSAFKVNSISYLLKPVKEEEVRLALNKLESLRKDRLSTDIKSLVNLLRQKNESYKSHILVSVKGGKLIPLKVADIGFINIEDGIVKAHTYDNKVYFMDQILDELMERLNPREFYRANRQYIIARSALKDIDHWFQSRLSVNLTIPVTEKILISRAKVQEFKDWFTGSDSL